VGKYKLIVGDPNLKHPYNGYNGWNNTRFSATTRQLCTKKPCLFDILTDVRERCDLADKLPDVLQRMVQRYSELRESEVSLADSGLCPEGAPNVDGCYANVGSGVWSPWL
jgi:hypothetical protein